MNWSKMAWAAALPVYNKILELDFIAELMNGSLPREKFNFYIEQDALYLADFGKVLAFIAAKLDDSGFAEDFLGFAKDTMLVERAVHETYLQNVDTKNLKAAPACALYTGYLHRINSTYPVEVAAASVLPCFWIYKEVGDYILAKSSRAGNPYEMWINTYGGDEYGSAVKRAIEICDTLAAGATEKVRSDMTEAFVTASRMEWMFWQSAYELEQWPV